MTLLTGTVLCIVILLLGVAAIVGNMIENRIRQQGLDQWVPSYLRDSAARHALNQSDDQPLDVFIAICDHFEPETGKANPTTALSRVDSWVKKYPRRFDPFRDVSGRPPQHTFFFPQDEYRPEYIDRLSDLIQAGYGDIDVHLHHHDDTADGFREKLEVFSNVLHHRHGLLRCDPETGKVVYGFIHGNWALCNSRRDGKWCGVDHEIPILKETGCYADFTMPSAPSDTQTQTVNQIYYAFDRPGQRKSHNSGQQAAVGSLAPSDGLLMIQGPLLFDWSRKKWGLIPKIENGDLLASHPPLPARLNHWLRAGIVVQGRPNWRFVKLHTHGCKPGNLEMWLDGSADAIHRELADRHRQNPNFRYHYVTAWEMAQLVHMAEAGRTELPWQNPTRATNDRATSFQRQPSLQAR